MNTKEKAHIYLLAGQSNMAGRGIIEDEDRIIHPRTFAQSKGGDWVPAVSPIHYDKPFAGVGLGESFAAAIADNDESILIHLVPAACGGSSIATWEPGIFYNETNSYPYNDAIARTRLAMKDGVLKGILWHQGEGDCNETSSSKYEKRLTGLIERFRTDLEAPQLPFVIGQLGQFTEKPWDVNRERVDQSQRSISHAMSAVTFVSSHGLTPNQDNIHFNAQSLREFGKRYAAAYIDMVK